jgi:anti-anti-sigma regulatory factor
MTPTAATISVFAGDRCACIRLTGRANFTLGVELKRLLDELQQHPFDRFVFDLSACVLMDSTILGILTGFGLQQQKLRGEEQPSVIELLNPHERVAELIENLGVLPLFRVTHGNTGPAETLPERAHPVGTASREEITQACLEAHETLAARSAENAARFKDVTRFLAEDLKRLKGGQ